MSNELTGPERARSVAIFALSLWIVQGLATAVSAEEIWQARASGAPVSLDCEAVGPPA